MCRVSRIAGFSLIEFAILMIIFGGLAAAATLLGDKWIEKEEHKSSKLNAKTVEEALDAYRKVNKRLPCPADPALNPGDAGFGEELYTGGVCAGTLPAAAGGSGNAVVGVLPTKTLGLGENLVTDNWGNRFDYYLDKRMATENAFSVYPPANTTIGDIEVRDESGSVRTDKAIYAIVSRGANERGALTRAGTLKNAATSDLNEQANNHFNASGTASAKDNVVVQASAGKDFDDIVMFKTRAMMGSGGKLAVPQGCDSQPANWTQGANSCTGSVSAMADGDTATVTDSTAPTTGQVTASCNGGTVTYSGESCTSGSPCGAGTVNWTVGAKNCSASVPATASGLNVAATDSTAPQTGAATATCTNGVWSTSSTTCFNQCAATTHLWSDPDGSDCNGNVPLTAHGSAPVVASTGPGNGNVTATCNDGVFAYSSATCTDDADCLATTLPWTVGANSCSGTIAQTANAATATATDASHAVSPGGSGTANFTCNDGTWNTTPSAANCNAQCAANTQNWTVGGAPCSSAYAILNHDPATNVPLSDASAPSTGTANIRCNNGVVALQSGSTCSTTCAAGTENWTQGANSCTAARASLAGGASANLNDTTGPDTGSVTVTCNNATGAVAQSSATCSAFVNCPAGTASWTVNDNCAAQVVSWTVGGRTCSGNALATNDGATTATITDSTQALAPGGHGTATFTCNDGTFDVNAGATCESQCNVAPFGVVNDNASVTAYSAATVACGGSCAAVSQTRTCNNGTLSGTYANASCSVTACAGCGARAESWTVGANSCDGSTPALAHNGSTTVTDATGTTGDVTMTCTNGVLAQSGATCAAPTGSALYCWGLNTYGQLGDGSTTTRSAPTAVSGGHVFSKMAVEGNWTKCALKSDGSAWCWGRNNYGQIGDGTTTDRPAPRGVTGGHQFVDLSNGTYTMCGLKASGQVWCWGRNHHGQVGDGTTTDRTTPTLVSGGHLFKKIVASVSTTCGIRTDDRIYCWGDNEDSEVGDGTTTDRTSPRATSGGYSYKELVRLTRGWGAIRTDNVMMAWGQSTYGELGIGSGSSVPVAISGVPANSNFRYGGNVSYIFATNGNGYAAGNRRDGMVADGYCNGSTNSAQTTYKLITGGLSWKDIQSSGDNTCGLATNGQAYCWGEDSPANGTGNTTSIKCYASPAVSGGHVFDQIFLIAISEGYAGKKANGDFYTWGENDTSNFIGQLGDGTTTDKSTPTLNSNLTTRGFNHIKGQCGWW